MGLRHKNFSCNCATVKLTGPSEIINSLDHLIADHNGEKAPDNKSIIFAMSNNKTQLDMSRAKAIQSGLQWELLNEGIPVACNVTFCINSGEDCSYCPRNKNQIACRWPRRYRKCIDINGMECVVTSKNHNIMMQAIDSLL